MNVLLILGYIVDAKGSVFFINGIIIILTIYITVCPYGTLIQFDERGIQPYKIRIGFLQAYNLPIKATSCYYLLDRSSPSTACSTFLFRVERFLSVPFLQLQNLEKFFLYNYRGSTFPHIEAHCQIGFFIWTKSRASFWCLLRLNKL